MSKVKKLPNIQLKDKNISFEDFERIFGNQFKIVPEKAKSEAVKAKYEELTGQKVGNSRVHKKNRKADTSEDRERNSEDNQEQ